MNHVQFMVLLFHTWMCLEVLLLRWTYDPPMAYTMVEFFSGKGNVSRVFRGSGMHRVFSYEKNDGPGNQMDFLSISGFLLFACIKTL